MMHCQKKRLCLVAWMGAGWLILLPAVPAAPSSPGVPPAQAPVSTNAPAATNAQPRLAESHRLGPQDKLAYSILDDPVRGPEPEILSVNAVGEVSFRVSRGFDLAFTLVVKGKTLEEVRRELKQKLDADYYQDAQVKLELREIAARPGQVLFIGKGTRGNVLLLQPGEEKRIFEAVYQVGVTEWANLRKVKLTRVDPATQKTETRVIDLEEIKKGNRANNVILQDGDIIDVPEKAINIF